MWATARAVWQTIVAVELIVIFTALLTWGAASSLIAAWKALSTLLGAA